MRWTVHGERAIYDSDWIGLALVDVELPDGHRFDHHVVRYPREAAGTIVADPERGVLLLWRHRFTTDAWGWEIPAGRLEEGESPAEAARREALEETGWAPHEVEHLLTFHPASGVSDLVFHVHLARGADHVGEPSDPFESERIEWVPVERVRRLLADGQVHEGMSVAGLAYALALGHLA